MSINILMYHYVRDNEDYVYDVFSRRKNEFIKQVEFLNRNFYACSISDKEEINYFLNSEEQGFILTFDDGYKDHLFCAEFLNQIGLTGIYFPSCNIFDENLLDVNLLHLILGNKDCKIDKLFNDLQIYIDNYHLKIKSSIFNYFGSSVDDYLKFVKPKRFQSKKISAFKFLLQRDIEGDLNRKNILEELFRNLYKKDFKNYVNNFYLTSQEMRYMKKLGSKFGSHGLSHRHLHSLNKSEQKNEIIGSFSKLKKEDLILNNDLNFLCYPYGSYNKDTLDISSENKVDFAFTVEAKLADLRSQGSVLELPRWDTNNFWDQLIGEPKLP